MTRCISSVDRVDMTRARDACSECSVQIAARPLLSSPQPFTAASFRSFTHWVRPPCLAPEYHAEAPGDGTQDNDFVVRKMIFVTFIHTPKQ
jgi:hypothetical protein